jgi:hypothetical protein
MRRNAAENAMRFAELGLARDKMPVIDCRHCGTAESALFWSLTVVTKSSLHLHCPTCESYGVRYHAARGKLVHSRSRRGKLGTATEAVAALMLIVVLLIGASVVVDGGLTRHNWSMKSAEAQRQITLRMESAALRAAPGHLLGAGFARRDWLAAAARGGETFYFATGDQQSAIRSLMGKMGPRDARLLRSVTYLPEEGQTRLILAGDSRAWRSSLKRCGWNTSADFRAVAQQAGEKKPTCSPQVVSSAK